MDEFGGVAGLVTLDDVLTEVMGEIADEFRANEPRPERLDDGRVRLPGWLRLDEAEPWIGMLWEGEADTVGGRVMEELGHVPRVGETVRDRRGAGGGGGGVGARGGRPCWRRPGSAAPARASEEGARWISSSPSSSSPCSSC